MTYCNTRENPVITTGYPGMSRISAAACCELKKKFDPENAERAAVLLMAELAGLKLDSQIFRRKMPQNLRCGMALTMTGEAGSPLGYKYREYSFLLSGKDENPATLHRRFAAIRAGLPREMFIQISSSRLPEAVSFVNWECKKTVFEETACYGAFVTAGIMEMTAQLCFAP